MARTRVRRRRTTLTVTALALSALLLGPVGHALDAGAAVRHPAQARTVVVRPGDSLWTIARRAEPGSDPRAVVDAIAAANQLDPAGLVPGARLVVPAP